MTILRDLIGDSVTKVVVETNAGTFAVNDPLKPADPNQPPPLLLRLLAPRVTVYDANGEVTLQLQPADAPSAFPWLAMLGLLVLAGGIVAIGAAGRAL